MKGFWKKLLTIAAISGAAYVGVKGYKRVTSIVKLSKSLPDYLENMLDEKPKISISMALKTLKISVGLTQEAFDKEVDLVTHIKEYVEDFYPTLAAMKLDVNTYVKAEETEECDDDDECCCSDPECHCCEDDKPEE